MSDHWEYFPCRMGRARAFVFYDHGIQAEIDERVPDTLVRIKVELKEPDPEGLPGARELEPLAELERQLAELVAARGGAYVGRVTVDGAVHYHAYLSASEAAAGELAAALFARQGFGAGSVATADPTKQGYWRGLFPSDSDWQTIKDRHAIAQLEAQGDTLAAERRVDHWAYFESPAARDAFAAWARGEGYGVETRAEPEPDERDPRPSVRLHHWLAPRIEILGTHTAKLLDKALELGGEYDGWETSVQTP